MKTFRFIALIGALLLVYRVVPAKQINTQPQDLHPYRDALQIVATSNGCSEVLRRYGIDSAVAVQLCAKASNIKANDTNFGESTIVPHTIASLDVTTIAVGLSRFLANRAKSEVTKAFIDRFKNRLQTFPEIRMLFPTTLRCIEATKSLSFSAAIQPFRDAFQADLRNLQRSVVELASIDSSQCNGDEDCCKRVGLWKPFWAGGNGKMLKVALKAVNEWSVNDNPIHILNETANAYRSANPERWKESFKILETAAHLSQAMRGTKPHSSWVGTQDFEDRPQLKIYFAVLMKAYVEQSTKKKFPDVADTVPTEAELLKKYSSVVLKSIGFDELLSLSDRLSAAIARIKIAEREERAVPVTALYDYTHAFVDFVTIASKSSLFRSNFGETRKREYDSLVGMLNDIADIQSNLISAKYTGAVVNLMSLFSKFGPTEGDLKSVMSKLQTTALFIAAIAEAQSAEEVEQAMETFALPEGSYSTKRESESTLGVNGYVGYNYSWIPGIDLRRCDSLSHQLVAPIGLTWSYSIGKGWAVSVFAQLLDLGALVRYHYVQGDTAALPAQFSVKLSNVFSPGFGLGVDVPGVPVSFMVGGRMIPTLFTPQYANNVLIDVRPESSWRWGLSLLVDIPLFDLCVTPKAE